MALCVQRYMHAGKRYRVVDFGSRISPKQSLTHRQLLDGHDCEYTGVDIQAGRNVDLVMKKPYRVPLKSNIADVVFAGQVFEHIPFFWASVLELARVMKPGGYLFLTVPSRGHLHSKYDCWRYYPDGLRAMAAFTGLELREAHTDFPPNRPSTRPRPRHDFAKIDTGNYYWGDTVGVFQKPARYPAVKIAILRAVVLWWANRIGDLSAVPEPPSDPAESAGPEPAVKRGDVLGVGARRDDSA
jgi:SAM-dependent methyltransferase